MDGFCKESVICVGAWFLALILVAAITALLGFEIKAGMANTAIHILFSLFTVYTVVLGASLFYLMRES